MNIWAAPEREFLQLSADGATGALIINDDDGYRFRSRTYQAPPEELDGGYSLEQWITMEAEAVDGGPVTTLETTARVRNTHGDEVTSAGIRMRLVGDQAPVIERIGPESELGAESGVPATGALQDAAARYLLTQLEGGQLPLPLHATALRQEATRLRSLHDGQQSS